MDNDSEEEKNIALDLEDAENNMDQHEAKGESAGDLDKPTRIVRQMKSILMAPLEEEAEENEQSDDESKQLSQLRFIGGTLQKY